MSDEVTHMAGRCGPHRESHEPRLDALKFVADGEQPVAGFIEWDGTKGLIDWGMDHNDVWGDCWAAACDHANIAKTGAFAQYGQLGMPKFAGTLGTYFAMGLANGEVGVPPNQPDQPDEGTDNATGFGFLFKEEIIDGYKEVPLNYLDWYAQKHCGIVVGLTIDAQQAIADFNARPRIPWSFMRGAADGHDVLVIATHADGSGLIATWGGLIAFEASFRENFTDAWVSVDQYDANFAALLAELNALHGTTRVVVPPPVVMPPDNATDDDWLREAEARIRADIKKVPPHIAQLIHAGHEIADAAMKHEAVAILEKIFADAIKIYVKGRI